MKADSITNVGEFILFAYIETFYNIIRYIKQITLHIKSTILHIMRKQFTDIYNYNYEFVTCLKVKKWHGKSRTIFITSICCTTPDAWYQPHSKA